MYFLLWFWFGQGWLLYDFDSKYLFGLLRYKFIASGKSALAEKIALKVSSYLVIIKIVIMNELKIFVCFSLQNKLRSGCVGCCCVIIVSKIRCRFNIKLTIDSIKKIDLTNKMINGFILSSKNISIHQFIIN